VLVESAQAHRQSALDVLGDSGHGQAAFLVDLFALPLADDRVHHREPVVRAALQWHVHDEHALRHAHLVRGQPDALVGLHGLEQVGHQRVQRVVELADLARLQAQHRIAVDADGSQRHRYFPSVSTWVMALLANSTLVSSEMRSTARSASMLTTVANMRST